MRATLRLPLLGVLALGAAALLTRIAAGLPATRPSLPTLPPEGAFAYEVRDAADGKLIPCKLTFVGVAGTHDPRFTTRDIGRQEGDAIAAYNRLLSASGTGVAHVPVGSYDVYVSRGPEWDLHIARKIVVGPRPAELFARLRHVVDTAGWLSADFHVHSAASSDSRVPMNDRVYEFVADGVDMIVSTDHNVVSDYAPIIEELGLRRHLTSAPGDELTTGSWGHFGAFPLPHDLERTGQGAVLVHGRDAKDFFADVRRNAPEAIIDVHHPRIDSEIGYFNLGRLDARADRAERAGFSWDFDAVEVLNGYQDSERRSVDRIIDDWFALIDHGHIVTATGNSDTHHLDHNIGGYPRNYVQLGDDAPERVQASEVARAVKGHHLLFTTAPFVRLRVDAGNIGDTISVHAHTAQATIEVQAAPWVSVSRVTLYVGGKEVQRWAVPPSTAVVRFRQTYAVTASRDTYVVVRVDGDRPLTPIVGDAIHFDVLPLALTNPVFLDVDGNGRYDALVAPHRH